MMDLNEDTSNVMRKKKIKHKKRAMVFTTESGTFEVNDGVTENTTSQSPKKFKQSKKEKIQNVNENEKLNDSSNVNKDSSTELSGSLKKKKKRKRKSGSEGLYGSSNKILEGLGESPNKKKKLQHFNKEFDQAEQAKRKNKSFKPSSDDNYKPGMLSDVLQMKKYGQVVLPWDPSFGLDKKYKKTLRNEEEDDKTKPNLKINPLFDLSKRKKVSAQSPNQAINSVFFVGNLPNNTSVSDVKKLFGKYGKIIKVKLHRTKAPKKGAKDTERQTVNASVKFIYLKSKEGMLSMNGTLYEDHHLRVDLAKNEPQVDREKTVFVGNLAFDTQDDDLWKVFEDCGEIESVRIVRDFKTKLGKGVGYVNFKSAESVEAAVELNGKTVLGRELRVRRWDKNAPSLSNEAEIRRKRVHKKLRKPSQNDETTTVEGKLKTGKAVEESSLNSSPKQSKIKKMLKKTDKQVKKKKKKNKQTNETTD